MSGASICWDISGLPAKVRALIIRIGFGGTIYYKYNKEPPKRLITMKAPTLRPIL